MDNYLTVLKQKANKINADIESCGNDKDCITNIIALKVKSNLENEDLDILKHKANEIKAEIHNCEDNKICILDAIKKRVIFVLEEQNQQMTSLINNQDFKPLYFGDNLGVFSDIGE